MGDLDGHANQGLDGRVASAKTDGIRTRTVRSWMRRDVVATDAGEGELAPRRGRANNAASACAGLGLRGAGATARTWQVGSGSPEYARWERRQLIKSR